MACPAILDSVISVGGFVPKCTKRLENPENMWSRTLQSKPPNAGWVEPPKGEAEKFDEYQSDVVVCTGQNCTPSPGQTCKKHRRDVEWEYNVPHYRDKPDTLGPAVIPTEGNPSTMTSGTSWAVPFVTSVVAEMISGAKTQNATLTPQDIRRGIRQANRPLDDGPEKMLNGTGAIQAVFNEQGLRLDIDWGDAASTTSF